jgi:hypothetical protein
MFLFLTWINSHCGLYKGYEALTVVKIHATLWQLTMYLYSEDGGSRLLRNISTNLPDYTVS